MAFTQKIGNLFPSRPSYTVRSVFYCSRFFLAVVGLCISILVLGIFFPVSVKNYSRNLKARAIKSETAFGSIAIHRIRYTSL